MRQGPRPTEERRPARVLRNARWLGAFWGATAVTVGGGLLFLQYLGPPVGPSVAVSAAGPESASGAGLPSKEAFRLKEAGHSLDAAPALRAVTEAAAQSPANDAAPTPNDVDGDQSPIEVELRRFMLENDQAIRELERRLNRIEPAVGAGLGAPAAVADGPLDLPPDALSANPERMPVDGTASTAAISPALPRAEQDLVPGPAAATPALALASATAAPKLSSGVDARPVASSAASPTASFAEVMIRRADALLQRGDVSAARLLYERAAAAGSSNAATAMGKTFEAALLAEMGVTGMSADPALAAAWYRRALMLRDAEARNRLQAVPLAVTGATQAQQP